MESVFFSYKVKLLEMFVTEDSAGLILDLVLRFCG